MENTIDYASYDRIRPIRWTGDTLDLLDQRKLPFSVEYVPCQTSGAVAVAMRDGPEAGLARIDALDPGGALEGYHLYHAARADLLRRLERPEAAAAAYRVALAHATNPVERRFLERRVAEVSGLRERAPRAD